MTDARGQVEAIFPLSPSQTGMWVQSVADTDGQAFVEQAAWRLQGDLDLEALRQAWQLVLDRHAALRGAVLCKGEDPLLVVVRQMPLRIREESAPDADAEPALERLLAAERASGFTLNRPPLIRFALLHAGPRTVWWIITFHHLILDGWSLAVLWSEALAAYSALVAGQTVALPAPASYRDFVAWLKTRSAAQAERYWRHALEGFAGANRIAGKGDGGESRELARTTAPAANAALLAAAAACQVPPAVVVETLWALLVAGRTGSDEAVIGVTVSGRPPEIAGVERLVGCFINTVPLRCRFADDATLADRIREHAARRVEQAEFEYCSGGQIHGWSGLPPEQPLFRNLLVFENLPVAASDEQLPVRVTGQRVHGARTAFPLSLLVSPGGADRPLHLRFVFQPGAIGDAAVDEIAADFERLLTELPQRLDAPVAETLASITVAPVNAEDTTTIRPPYVAPRSRLEFALCRIWEALFRRSPIGVLDDFFALGGHSLLALQLATRVRAELGLELPLHRLIGQPTIEGLALTLGAASDGEAGALIQLASGDGVPVYCPHPLGGHVLCYTALARRLQGRHPCWGLQAKGLHAGETPPADWDELLAHHWALLPHDGPLILLGYSYGGYLAMELAERRRQAGHPVLRVVLLDVPHPSVIPPETTRPSRAVLLHSLFGHALGLDLAALEAMAPGAVLGHVYQLATEKHLLPPGASLETVSRLLDVAFAHSRLEPPIRRYGFPVTLLRAREGAQRISSRGDLGWPDYVSALDIVWVDGSHETMLDERYIDDLVRAASLA